MGGCRTIPKSNSDRINIWKGLLKQINIIIILVAILVLKE